jgi:hypothetical protein
MKTIPFEEITKAIAVLDPHAEAALLAHFYRHGPELVQAVKDLIQSNEALHAALKVDHSINLTLSDATRPLAKASTVQMP